MAGERRINWGADATDAKYRSGDDDANSRFIVAEDLDGSTVLLQWDEAAGEWVYGGPIDLSGSDINDGAVTVYDASTDTVGDGTTSADHASVNTGQLLNEIADAKLQASYDGLVVPIGAGLGMSDAIDPANTTTPVQDAIDAVSAVDGGAVLLPHGKVQEADTINPKTDVWLIGHGMLNTTIEITATGVPGIDFTQQATHLVFADFNLLLPGPDANDTGPAMEFTEQVSWSIFKRLRLSGVRGNVINHNSPSSPFQIRFEGLDIRICDAGNADALINIDTPGPAWDFSGPIVLSPTDSHSGVASEGFNLTSINGCRIGQMNVGGTVGRVLDAQSVLAIDVSTIHYEPTTQPTTPTYIVSFRNQTRGQFDGLTVASATADYAIGDFGANMQLPRPATINSTINNSLIYLDSNTRPSFYMGSRSDVDSTATSGPPYFWCAEEMLPANPRDEGTVTVTSGGEGNIFDVNSGSGEVINAKLAPVDPGEDVQFSKQWKWLDSASETQMIISDKQSTADYDVQYIVY